MTESTREAGQVPTPARPDSVRRRPKWLMRELPLVMTIMVVGFFIGTRYLETFRATGQPYDFAQVDFGAAVAVACGHGFVDPGPSPTPAFAEFLHVKRDAITCADIPEGTPLRPPNFTQGLYRYLMITAGLVWIWSGISWSALWPLFGVSYAVALAAAYGLFRLGMGRAVACLITALLAMSAINMSHVVFLRDYSKAPFILLLMLVMAWLARSDRSPRQRLWLSAAFGVTLGIGFGFRNDLLILWPAFAVVIAVRVGGFRVRDLPLRLGCVAAAVMGFVIAAWPMLVAYSRGSNNGHVIMLGFMTPFDADLGIRRSLYDWGYTYSDSYVATLAESFSARTADKSVGYVTPEYDRALMAYISELVRTFPADMVTRAYASALKIFEMPFAVGTHPNPIPYGIHHARVAAFYEAINPILHSLEGKGVYMVVGALALIAGTNVVGALLLTALVLYFSGYPALQFHVRHFFYLEFITWWAFGFLIQRAISARWRGWQPQWLASWRRVATFVVLVALMVFGPIAALRAYQSRQVGALLAHYESATKSVVATQRMTTAEGRTVFAAPDLWQRYENPSRQNIEVETEYLTATFAPAGCNAIDLHLRLLYEPNVPIALEMTRTLRLPLTGGNRPTSIMFAAFWKKGWTKFSGIEMSPDDSGCFQSLSRTNDLSGMPLALNLTFPPDWQSRRLYQTVANREPAEGPPSPVLTFLPASFSLQRAFVDGPLWPMSAVSYHAPLANQVADGTWVLAGLPETPTGYLLQYEPRPTAADSVLVVQGHSERGGITIGFQENDLWAGYVNIRAPGPFMALMKPKAAGVFRVVIAASPMDSLFETRGRAANWLRRHGVVGPPTKITITRAGWSLPPLVGSEPAR